MNVVIKSKKYESNKIDYARKNQVQTTPLLARLPGFSGSATFLVVTYNQMMVPLSNLSFCNSTKARWLSLSWRFKT